MALTKASYSLIAGAVANVLDYGAVNDGTGDQTAAIQAAIDALATTGGAVFLPTGIYRTLSTLNMKTGVSLKGTGYSYQYTTTDLLKGSWIKYEGSSGTAALYITDCQNLCVSELGIFCGPVVAGNRIGIFMTSDNNPSVKHITFERICVAAASICVKWGNGLSLEQVDAITFRDFYFESCNYGFVINGANSSDYSLIERGTLSNVIVAGFELTTPKLLHITSCAQGGTDVTTKMFNITGGATSPVWITQCQSEGGGGYFMYAVGPNDQMQIVLENNTINQRSYFEGILRVTSRNNYMNNRIDLRNGVFWRSEEDRIFKSTPQAITWDVVSSAFYATTMMESGYWYGYRLPIGFQFYNLTFIAFPDGYLGKIIIREGVYCNQWAANTAYILNAVAVPTVDNTYYYKATVAGTTAATQPVWPTVVGNTVTDGTVTWTCTGTSALEKSVSAIAA